MITHDSKQIAFFKRGEKPRLKVITGLRPFIGGAGLATKLFKDFGHLCLAGGPLSGAYPATGVVIVAREDGKLWQLGDDFVLKMALRGVDGVVAEGLELEGLRPQLESFLETLTETPIIAKNPKDYEALYQGILARVNNVWVAKSDFKKACPTCPLACGRNLKPLPIVDLGSLLGSCLASTSIYSDPAVAFAALQALGYDYSHEELERAVKLAQPESS